MPNIKPVDRILDRRESDWMKESGSHSDIVISSRVRIARNLAGTPFPQMANADLPQVLERIETAIRYTNDLGFMKKLWFVKLEDVSLLERRVLVEKHIISPSLAATDKAGVATDLGGSVSVMVNEEDHLRIQCIKGGLDLTQAWEEIDSLDDILESNLNYAFHSQWGYLTACPTNVGTGVRASVMIHLPALNKLGQTQQLFSGLTRLGLTARGCYGEGSEAVGSVYQISNQVTLGVSESEIIDGLTKIIGRIVNEERAAEKHILDENKMEIVDFTSRSLAILSNAHLLTANECAELLSTVRLGIRLGLIKGLSIDKLNWLLVCTSPSYLTWQSKKSLSPVERDVVRASLLRQEMIKSILNIDISTNGGELDG